MAPVRSGVWRSLVELQAELLRGADARRLLDPFLALLIEHTGSASGFLGEVVSESGARLRFQLLAGSLTEGFQPFVDAVLSAAQRGSSGRLVKPSALPVPPGSFPLLLPLQNGEELVGMVGLTPPPAREDAELLSELQPMLSLGTLLLSGGRHEQRRRSQEAEHRLQQEELSHLRQVLAAVEEGLWDWNLQTRELRVSRRWLELLGYMQGELEPTFDTWKSLCHPEDLPEVEQLIAAHLEGYTPWCEFAYRARSKAGTWAWILSRARVVARDEKGLPLRMVGADVDITARKHSEERLRALFRAIPDLLFRIRGDGTFIDWNDGSPEPTALPSEAFMGKKIQNLPMPRPFIEQTLTNVNRVIRDGNLAVYEYELEKPQGVQRYEARVVRSGPDEAVCIVRNITDRKLMEERQGQLIRAEKLASLGQLAAGIAHEINNPVSYVSSNLRMLEKYIAGLLPLLQFQHELLEGTRGTEQSLSAEQLSRLRELWKKADVENLLSDLPEVIQESLTGTKRITEIVQSLRSFSREDSGSAQAVDLNAELESTLRMVWNELKYKCELVRDFGPLPPITCHPTQIAQVFTNLLVNASQAIETFGEIRIRTRQQDAEAVVEISDTGKGMTEETLSKLFTPFFTTKPRGQGTGLGLSISRDIILRHGGRIEVTSVPGKGSTFIVTLPTSGPAPRPPTT
ncbi:PAS domain-containing sensor histidine kinase [Hyalangium minutum]|uniref:histidine kinase n=1 Tax=Hyalangium minutum TaxID=394096 RepID=A0A085WV75_9BACT|nr:ATP-binding protein [Hyalangium minutum]KFE71588.1 Signal transduction histidine kinase [Hyalangium minutum]